MCVIWDSFKRGSKSAYMPTTYDNLGHPLAYVKKHQSKMKTVY